MSNTKMKGRLKGLRYISQIFANEKEPEMQIGNPTDVMHVAHIGWDGPSVNSAPSWSVTLSMNEFQGPPAFQSAPLSSNGYLLSEEQKEARAKNTSSDMQDVPKSSRRQTSSTSERSDRPKQNKSSKSSSSKDVTWEGRKPARRPKDSSTSSDSQGVDVPKKSRKKSKDGVGSMKSRNRQGSTDQEEETVSKLDSSQSPGLNHFEDG